MRLLGGSAWEEEGGAVDDGVDAVHGRVQRAVIEEIAPHDFHVVLTQLGRATGIAHERADLITPDGEAFCEAASNLSGRSSDEDSHSDTVARRSLLSARMGASLRAVRVCCRAAAPSVRTASGSASTVAVTSPSTTGNELPRWRVITIDRS